MAGPTGHAPAIALWAALFACGCVILLGAAAIAWRQNPDRGRKRTEKPNRRPSPDPRHQPAIPHQRAPRLRQAETSTVGATRKRRATLRAELTESAEEAARLGATARRAEAAAAKARHHTAEAQRALEDAERAYDAAQQAYERAAAEVGQLSKVDAPSAGERELSRAALGAYRRGDITVEDLQRLWLGASGWDARHEDAEQMLLRLRAHQLEARRTYHMARSVVQQARRAEEVAEVAAKALADEVIQAEQEVARLRGGKRRSRSE
jgi:hypothetical protein